MNIDTKIDMLTMLTFAQIKAKIKQDVDKLLKELEFVTLRDMFEVVCRGNVEKWNYLKEDIKEALKNYDYYKHTWYYKPLKVYTCKQCKKQFKTKSSGQWFCCDRCKNLYQEVNRLYGDYKT